MQVKAKGKFLDINVIRGLVCVLLISASYPLTFSRLITTFDAPGEFELSLSDLNGPGMHDSFYSTKPGINIAYEHLITKGGIQNGPDIYIYAGGEFMFGRRSDVNVSFHSVYIKPAISLSEKILISFSAGLSKLNTDQPNFILDMGSLISAGIEYQLSKNMSIMISGSIYNLFEGSYSVPLSLESTPFMNVDFNGLNKVDIDMQYKKAGISVIYGFDEN